VLLTTLRANDRGRFCEQLPDLAQLARDAQRLHSRSGLIRLDEAVHESVEPREGFFHRRR
jgi:hypothetical protein